MAKLPAFTSSRVPKTIEPPAFEVRPLPGRGFGVVANKTIERGDRIMGFQPIVAVHGDAFKATDHSDYSFYNSALHQLPNASLALYTNLAAHFQHEDNDDNWERLNTNAFSEELGGKEHWLMLPETARMNHDCRPNAIYYFDHETLTHYVHATRRIFVGEEITVPYSDPVQTRKERVSSLRHSWGFTCTCSLCQASPEYILESNRRIKTILKLTEQLEDPQSSASPETGELLISLYETERLYSSIADAYLLTSMAYNSVGNDWKTVEFAMKAVEATMVNYGPKSTQVKQAKQLMLSPRSHESWMSRK